MKKSLLLGLMLTAAFAASASPKTLDYNVIGLYDDESYEVPNYLIQLSDDETAKYDQRAMKVTMSTGYLLQLDLYNVATDPRAVVAGTYTPKTSEKVSAGTYDADYSELSYYEDGKLKTAATRLSAPIEITTTGNGVYTVTTTAKDPVSGQDLELSYTGRLPLSSTKDKPSSFTQLRRDLLDANLDKGGICFYQGVSDYSNNGVSYLNLYSAEFNDNGGMPNDGINLVMMVAHKKFAKKELVTIIPGTYTNATTLARNTWYPCREIEYALGNESVSMPFGSYVRIRKNGEYTYGYLKTGTFVLETDGNGNVNGTLDAYTDLGYHVTASFSGPMSINTDNATFKSGVSNLIDDVDLDFSKLNKGYISHDGLKGGCRVFTVDLGSSRDSEIYNGGDLMRLEFLAPTSTAVLQPGVYTVVPIRWNDYELHAGGTYEPMSLNKGYFNDQGLMIGTRYAHYEEGRYRVWDFAGPADSGTVKVETTDHESYRFEINLVDDSGFEIRGSWDKPIEYLYDRNALEEEIKLSGVALNPADESNITVAVDNRTITVANAGDATVLIFDLNGRKVAEAGADTLIDASKLAPAVYILSVNNKSFKLILK